jgi:hypothetical protein
MNRRKFLKSAAVIPLVPTSIMASTIKKPNLEYDRRSHLEGGTYYCPNTLFSPEEIVEAGFVFVPHPSCIHRFDDPYNPIMKSYCDGSDTNLLPVIMKTRRFCVSYYKDYDPCDSPRWRGIEGVCDYFIKKDIFKPAIIKWMKEMEFHYVYKVLLEASPAFYEEKEISKKLGSPHYCYRHAVNVRGCRFPKRA